jgi:hypothetical protein
VGARGLGLLLLLAIAGGAAGYAWSGSSANPGFSSEPATPVEAAGPAFPFTPPEKVRPDAELPPLAPSLTLREEELGPHRHGGVVLPAPVGWTRTDLSDREARWVPAGSPSGSYGVRVAVVDLRRSLAQVVAERAAALPLDPRITDTEILSTAGDTLRASFILDGYRRLQISRWVSFDGAGIDLEVSATGRLIDEQGLEALVARIATDVRTRRR